MTPHPIITHTIPVSALAGAPGNPKKMPTVAETPFAATPLSGGQKAKMSVTGLNVAKESQLKFKVYEATFNQKLKICINGLTNCQDITKSDVALTDRQWRDVIAPIPAGTTSVSMIPLISIAFGPHMSISYEMQDYRV